MSFLNAIFLGGMAALFVPLLIHLWNRSRFRTVDWGATHLLVAAISSNSRQWQWHSLLLLLLRCLIPVLFAVSLARPVLTHYRVAGAQAAKSLLFLLDTTLSMEARSADASDGASLFASAKNHVGKIAQRARDAETSLWSSGVRASDLLGGTSLDSARISEALERQSAKEGGGRALGNLSDAIDGLGYMSHPNKQLILASDFQANEWRNVTAAQLNAVKSKLLAFQPPAQLLLLPLSAETPGENLSVAIRSAPLPYSYPGDSQRIIAEVRNHGAQPVSDVGVDFYVDGQALSSRSITLLPGSAERLEFGYQPMTTGWHDLAISVNDASTIHGDDWAFEVVQVVDPKRVLIVDDSSSVDDSFAVSRYLQLALAPFQGNDRQSNRFTVDVVLAQELNLDRLAGVDVIIVADVRRFSELAAESIEEFVRGGGGLILFASETLERKWFNDRWGTQMGLMPVRYGSEQTRPADQPARLAGQSQQSKASWSIDDPTFDIAWQASTGADFSQVAITRWRSLETANLERSDLRFLMQLTSGASLLVGAEYGQGYVLQCGLFCSDVGSNLPLGAAFVPLMQTLVESLVVRESATVRLTAGDIFEYQLPSGRLQGVSGELLVRRQQLPTFTSGNAEVPTTLHQAGTADPAWRVAVRDGRGRFEQTQLPGIYSVVFQADLPAEDNVPFISNIAALARFSVSASDSESVIELMGHSELAKLADQLGATVIDSGDAYFALEQQRRDGRELWHWFLLSLLAVMFLEQLVVLRMTRGVSA